MRGLAGSLVTAAGVWVVGCGGPASDIALTVDNSTRHMECNEVAVSARRSGWASWTDSPVLVAAVDPLPQAASGMETEEDPDAALNYCFPREGEIASMEIQIDLGVVLEPGFYDEADGGFRLFVYGRDRAEDPWGDNPTFVEGFHSFNEGGLQVDKLESDEGGSVMFTVTGVGGIFAADGGDVPLDGAELRAQLFELDDRIDLSEL